MREIVHTPRCGALVAALEPLAAGAKVKRCHWISTPDGDEGREWCTDCGHHKVRHLRRHDRKRRDQYILDGGWRTEHDRPPFCAACGVKLDGSLTAYGAADELDYYRDNGVRPGSPDDALCLVEVLSALEWADQRDVDLAEEAADIAEAAIAVIREAAA